MHNMEDNKIISPMKYLENRLSNQTLEKTILVIET